MKLSRLLPLVDLLCAPLLVPCAWLMRRVRELGVHRLPLSKRVLLRLGVFPLRSHYYEPQFDFRDQRTAFSQRRRLPAIDWNVDGQLALLGGLDRADELADLAGGATDRHGFTLENSAFCSGDAEVWYQMIRHFRPRRIIEIGSGYSTRLARRAIERNRADDADYDCRHVCIEPYEQDWLEDSAIEVVREPVEHLGTAPFADLADGDFLFIDSSHVIRPQGDVLFEYLELLPVLAEGVIVHVHDIFTPHNYLDEWLRERVLFWNEQYLLEAFLSHNRDWEILAALNFLHHYHGEALRRAAPHLTDEREPGSFYFRRRGTH
ncbi:MAG: class I SAM-dependent methyltransferase [Gammaproteobacteria bacterium]